MFNNLVGLIRHYLFVSVPEKQKREFTTGIDRINVTRAKITSAAFIVLEIIQLLVSFVIKGDNFFNKPDIYYGAMYLLLLTAMIVFLLIFNKLGNNISEYGTVINITGVFFAVFLLLWCAGISLLDQLSYGQIIVYTVAVMCVAVTPIFEPWVLLLIYLTTHTVFIDLLPYFQKSSEVLFGDYINSTGILIIFWAISYMRYKKYIQEFNNKRVMQKNSEELKRVNKELQEANQKLEKLSQTDALTGIYNRLVFDKTLKTEWDRCKRHFVPLTLIMIDIDFFKAFNDSYGHQAGDDCLKRLAELFSGTARRSSDVVARYGGEEFAIILPYMKKEDAINFAERLRVEVEKLAIPHMNSSISEYITISLGIHTIIPSNSSSAGELIRAADKALYEAKIERNNIAYA